MGAAVKFSMHGLLTVASSLCRSLCVRTSVLARLRHASFHSPLLPAGWLLPKGPVGLPQDSLVLPLQPPAPLLAEVPAEVASFARLAFHPGRPRQRRLTAFF